MRVLQRNLGHHYPFPFNLTPCLNHNNNDIIISVHDIVYGLNCMINSLYMCVYIPAGFDVDGMYRISGKSNEVLRIKKDFDNGELCMEYL